MSGLERKVLRPWATVAWRGRFLIRPWRLRSPQAMRRPAPTQGHVGNNADFVPGHPEKLVDFAYRAIHEMAVASKAVIQAHYGGPPKRLVLQWLLPGRKTGRLRAHSAIPTISTASWLAPRRGTRCACTRRACR